jgi:hypothetical protein
MAFRKGDYVRFIQAPNTRQGSLVSDPDDKGKFLFQLDPRIDDNFPISGVFEDEIELCEKPTDAEIETINAAIRHG